MAGGGGSFPEWLLDEPGLSAFDDVGFFILMKRATIIMNLRRQSDGHETLRNPSQRVFAPHVGLCVGTGQPNPPSTAWRRLPTVHGSVPTVPTPTLSGELRDTESAHPTLSRCAALWERLACAER